MHVRAKLRHLSVVIITLFMMPEFSFSQTDYSFWFAAPEITYEVVAPPAFITDSTDRPIVLVLSTYDGPANVTISMPANPAFVPLTCTVLTDQFIQVDLTAWIDAIECKPVNTILNNGLLVIADKPINAIYEIQNRVNSESYSLKGRNALGYEFIIPSQKSIANYPACNPPARNSIAVVASEDQTLLKIVPSAGMEGQTGLDTITVLLNRGQTWNGRALSPDSSGHLGGSFVFADKPVAVTVTDDALRPKDASGLSIDIAGDQLIPRHVCSNEYLVICQNGAMNAVTLYIYAYEDATAVSIDGFSVCNLNRGEVCRKPMSPYTLTSYVQTNKTVLVYVLAVGINYSTEVAGQVFPPLTCAGSRKVSFCRTGPPGSNDDFWTYLLTRTENQANFTCSNSWIQGLLVPSNFNLIPETGNQWGFYDFGAVFPLNYTLTFTNSTGNFQATTFNELRPGALRYTSYTSYAALNLGTDQSLCPGDTMLLDAGYGRDSYLWSTGQTTQTILISAPGTYWVSVTAGDCTLGDTIVISNVNHIPVNLGGEISICSGDSALLDAGPGRSWYLWSTGQTTQSIFVHDSGTYLVTVPVANCSMVDSDTVLVNVASQAGLGPDRSMCSGDSVLLDAGPGMNSYLWNTGSTAQTLWATATGTYSVILHFKGCVFHDSVNVSAYPAPAVALGPDDTICDGGTRVFDAGLCSGCTYAWDNLSAGQFNIGSGQTYTASQPGTYRVTVTGPQGCPGRDTIQLFTEPGLPVSVTISPSANPVCEGSTVTFTSAPVNGGAAPVYQWTRNGMPVGTNSATLTLVPVNGELVQCTVTSSLFCTTGNPATSDALQVTVTPMLPVSIGVTASANPVCEGTQVVFAAAAVNGGDFPAYQWLVNGLPAGSNATVYTTIPANGDVVACMVTSSAACITGNPATSSPVSMMVHAVPVVSFSHCCDSVTTTTAKPFRLRGGLPPGGTYSGPGVNPENGMFNPAVAGPGTIPVTYTYTNAALCSAAESLSIINYQLSIHQCGTPITDVRDNQVYETVQIGSQCWMAANLDFGSEIPANLHQRDNCRGEKFCSSHVAGKCEQGASFYQWDELMNYEENPATQGLCPPGWHVPSESDWQTLFAIWTNNGFAGSPLKHTGYSGFNAFTGGARHLNRQWNFTGLATFFWSSSAHGPAKAWAHGMNEYDPSVSLYPSLRSNAFSVRCVRD